MLGFFLEHFGATVHDILLVGGRLRRLATTCPIKLGLGEPLDDAARTLSTGAGVASRVSSHHREATSGAASSNSHEDENPCDSMPIATFDRV